MSETTTEDRVEQALHEVVGISETWLKTAGKIAETAIEATGEGLRATLAAVERLGEALWEAGSERD